MQFRLGELFCGPGGLAQAAINAHISNPEYKIIHKQANDYELANAIEKVCAKVDF